MKSAAPPRSTRSPRLIELTRTRLGELGCGSHFKCAFHGSAALLEIEAAKAIASGDAVTDVTWEAINQMNVIHATDQASTTKETTLDLLRRNSREAAASVREFTDEQLAKAAPFSLSFGAPVTAQFFIEDHALLHSWHHLACICKAIGR